MEVIPLSAGNFKLDGGAMFGVVPKSIWSRMNPPDENNLCTWGLNSLLIKSKDRRILIDTGIGNKQNEKFQSHFQPHGKKLDEELSNHAVSSDSITDVILTHLHFDHVGGALITNEKREIVPTFENATYWTNQEHLEWALNPNVREKASFLEENILPLKTQERLAYAPIDGSQKVELFEGIFVKPVYGHTQAMMIVYIYLEEEVIIYAADLVPSSHHIRLPYVLSYDLQPLVTIEERKNLYQEAMELDAWIYLEHDAHYTKGKVGIKEGRYYWKELK